MRISEHEECHEWAPPPIWSPVITIGPASRVIDKRPGDRLAQEMKNVYEAALDADNIRYRLEYEVL